LRQEVLTESTDLQSWLARFKHDVAGTVLDLTQLSEAEIQELIRTLLEPDAGGDEVASARTEELSQLARFSSWLFQETEGQPFFLVETLKALVEANLVRPEPNSAAWQVDWRKLEEHALEADSRVLPEVREIIQGWLGRITTPAGELLTAAAVLGEAATFEHLCRVTDMEEDEALTALDELLARQLLLEADESRLAPGREPVYRFSHHKLGEVVYSEAGAARRRILHRRALETLQATTAPAAELAHHAFNAGLGAETIRYSVVAGNEALHLLAVRVAILHFEKAWQVTQQTGWPEAVSGADRQALYAGLGRAYELAEAWPQAKDTYQAMIDYSQAVEAAALECLGLNRLATVYINGFKDLPQAVALLEQARTVAEKSGDRRGLAETEWNLSVAAHNEQKPYLVRQHGERALAIARELGHPQLLARCLNSLAYGHGYLRHWDTVEAYATEARDLYAAAGNRILEADCQRLVGWSQMYTGRPRTSLATLQDTFDFSQQIENLWGQAECAYRLAFTWLELGNYGQAIRLARQGIKQTRRVGIPTMILLASSTWGTVQRTVMALESAQETLLELLAESTEKGLTGYLDWALAELCTVHALAGEWDRAYDYARRSVQSREDGALLPMSFAARHETEALLHGGDVDPARTEVKQMGKVVGNNKRYQLLLLRSQAVLAQWDGEIEEAIALLQTALRLAERIGLPGEVWSILGTLGTLHADQGHQTEAQRAWKASAASILELAQTIDEEDFQVGFLSSEPVQYILKASEAD
jgi:tetratricopeptide (TPR) repeat protein